MIALRKRFLLRYPHACNLTFWIFGFIDSPSALAVFNTIALMIPSRCFCTIDAARISLATFALAAEQFPLVHLH